MSDNRNDLLEKILSATQNAASGGLSNRVVVSQASDLAGTLDSSKEYFIDGSIDMGAQSIEIPSGGLTLSGYSFDLSKLSSSSAGYEMFTSPVGGSGNLILKDLDLSVTGAGSKVFNLTGVDTFRAIEIEAINYTNCVSLGQITDYRQMLETGTGRFGGAPELTFSGSWSGVRISTSIVRVISDVSALFKAGAGLSFSGRFVTGINCDLPTNGALLDFSDANFAKDESLEISGARITRNGAINTADAGITPNIAADNVRCLWSSNIGIPNTYKYIKSNITTELETTVASVDTYYPLLGTFTVDINSHFDMPSNGEFRLLSGNGSYQITGDIVIDGTQNNVLDLRVTKSTDGGVTWSDEINHIRRQVNSLVGGRDVAFFPLNFITTLKENDRVRLEIENKSSTANVTAELDSFVIISQV
jgi:hypothetical protein